VAGRGIQLAQVKGQWRVGGTEHLDYFTARNSFKYSVIRGLEL